jgi:hypothetical protein
LRAFQPQRPEGVLTHETQPTCRRHSERAACAFVSRARAVERLDELAFRLFDELAFRLVVDDLAEQQLVERIARQRRDGRQLVGELPAGKHLGQRLGQHLERQLGDHRRLPARRLVGFRRLRGERLVGRRRER